MPDWLVINSFYNGLGWQSRQIVDATAGGALWAKSYDEAYSLIETMVANDYQNPTARMSQLKVAGVLEVDAITQLSAQMAAMAKKIDTLAESKVKTVAFVCEICAGSHSMDQCAISSESVQYVSNYRKDQGQFQNTYHPNNRNHPNFIWSNNQEQQQNQFQSNQLFQQ